MSLTSQQQDVVSAPLSNLLVSAAAGSGKTKVLVERIAQRIIRKELDIRKVLVMTFTKAAAANMSNRLEKVLLDTLSTLTDPSERRYISEQVSYLPIAHISTIHSFCLDVIRNFGTELKREDGEILLEPGFDILDDVNTNILRDEAVDEIFERIYSLCHRTTVLGEEPGSVTVPEVSAGPEEDLFLLSLMDSKVTVAQWCEDFLRMTLSLSASRDDRAVKDIVIGIHSKLRSLPDYEKVVRDIISQKQAEARDFSGSSVAGAYLDDFKITVSRADQAVAKAENALGEIVFVKDKKKNLEYANLVSEWVRYAKDLKELCDGSFSWNDIVEKGKLAPAGKWPGFPGASSEDLAKKDFFDTLTPLYELVYILTGKILKKDIDRKFFGYGKFVFGKTAEEIQQESLFMLPVISRLFETVLLADQLYSIKKRKENAVDFPDQEHFASYLLSNPEIAENYRNQFDEIYIDEYQDNSRIQDAIVIKFSKSNVFFVGDIKQSIYRFRHACPDMFSERSDRYADGDGGTLFSLNRNFRSRPSILLFVNDLFSQVLTRESGDIDYDATGRLEANKEPFEDDSERKASVHIILIDGTGDQDPDLPEDETEEDTEPTESQAQEKADIKKSEREALSVYSHIQSIRRKTDCAWSDFAVLTRSNKEALLIGNILSMGGIPTQSPTESSIFSQRELLLMQNMIRLIDNACQDIPLSAVMRAPFPTASFSPEEMLSIVLHEDKSNPDLAFFHEKVNRFAEDGFEPLRSKVNRFLDTLSAFRTQAMVLKISELIEKIYIETGLMDYLSVRENGQERIAALETFRDWANQFESRRRGGLYQFVRFIEEIEKNNRGVDDFETSEQLRDVVRCMSIHKSKGLEFKNVFVCGIDKSFSGKADNSSFLFNDRMGVAIDYVDTEKGYKFPTISKNLLYETERRESLSEQLRLLYVAATRAEERLLMIGTFKRKKSGAVSGHEDAIADALKEDGICFPAWLVRNSKSYLDFILMGIARNPHVSLEGLMADEECTEKPVSNGILSGRTRDLTLTIEKAADANLTILRSNNEAERMPEGAPGTDTEKIPDGTQPTEKAAYPALSEDEINWFKLQISGRYPYEKLTQMAAKTTVSEVKRISAPEEDGENRASDTVIEGIRNTGSRRPLNLLLRTITDAPGSSDSLSASETGILLHSVFQYTDFAALPTHPDQKDIVCELEKLVRFKMIREEQLKHILPFQGAIAKFAASDLCSRMIRAESKRGQGPFREIPFSITVPVSEEDFCLVQGMIDCWFIEDGKAVLIDYKSDRIEGDLAAKEKVLRERYGIQLEYYARAIEAASKLKVKEKQIWLIPEAISFVL